jgi:hypothetical protein
MDASELAGSGHARPSVTVVGDPMAAVLALEAAIRAAGGAEVVDRRQEAFERSSPSAQRAWENVTAFGLPNTEVNEEDVPPEFRLSSIDVSDARVRRRVFRSLGPGGLTERTREIFALYVCVNEIDLRLGRAIEDGTIAEETKEIVWRYLERVQARLLLMLDDERDLDRLFELFSPEWLDGGWYSQAGRFVVGPLPRERRRRRGSIRTHASRRQRKRVTGRGSPRRDDDPEPPSDPGQLLGRGLDDLDVALQALVRLPRSPMGDLAWQALAARVRFLTKEDA